MNAYIEEGYIKGASEPIPLEETNYKKYKNCICVVNGIKTGTGFFTKILYENNLIPVLITNNHIINDKFLEKEKIIKIYINKKAILININKDSKIYSSIIGEFDITIIRVDEDDINEFLVIDENIFKDKSELTYKNENIFILHYPYGKEAKVSNGNGIEIISEYNIKHKCNTDYCSSGAPILSDVTEQVIGIHKGFDNGKEYNLGSFLKFPLLEINPNYNTMNNNLSNSSLNKKNVNNYYINEYADKNNNIENFNYSFSKLNIGFNKEEEDIISNSLCGMKNISNTDYINSSLQILIHIPQFVNIIRRNNHIKKDVIYFINKIFNLILNTKPASFGKSRGIRTGSIDPTDFIRYFIENNPKYNKGSQHDSILFLEDLIYNISSELSSLKYGRELNPINEKYKMKKKFFEYLMKSDKDTYFEINDLFYVYFIYIKKCRYCNFKSQYFDKTFGIKLNINKKIDLDSLLKEYFYEHNLNINCEMCYKPNIEVKARIAKLPKILIFRFQNEQKIPFRYSDMIDIRDFLYLDVCNDISVYKLFALNHFLGYSPGSGHYFSTILLEKNNSWYEFNDEYCKKIDPYSVFTHLNSNSIFYKQKNYN